MHVQPAEPIGPDAGRIVPHPVKRVLDHMSANMGERITLEDLSAACAVSERTLLRQFRQFVGVTPLAYLRRLRLNAAKSALDDPQNDDAVADIAIRCGLSHLGRFATAYRRQFGETPSATRQRVRAPTVQGALSWQASRAGIERMKPSVVILPLRTETLQESIEARDLTERLAVTLSRIRIAAITFAAAKHGASMTLRQPRNVGAEYCLLGRLARHGERTRVTIRLLDVATNEHLWGDSFDGAANDPFGLQDRVADGVLCGVVSRIGDAELERIGRKAPRDLNASDLGAKAMSLILKSTAISARRAIAVLNQALELHPADAVATALLAFAHFQLAVKYGMDVPAAGIETAVRLSRRARLLDNDDPVVLAASASVANVRGERDEADALLARAVAIDPTSPWVWERCGYAVLSCPISQTRHDTALREAGSDGAIARFQRAVRLNGDRGSRGNCFQGIASAHTVAGRWEEAEVWMRRGLFESPDDGEAYRNLFTLAFRMNDSNGMRRSVEQLRRAHPHLTVTYHADMFAPANPLWLEALRGAGMPLS